MRFIQTYLCRLLFICPFAVTSSASYLDLEKHDKKWVTLLTIGSISIMKWSTWNPVFNPCVPFVLVLYSHYILRRRNPPGSDPCSGRPLPGGSTEQMVKGVMHFSSEWIFRFSQSDIQMKSINQLIHLFVVMQVAMCWHGDDSVWRENLWWK